MTRGSPWTFDPTSHASTVASENAKVPSTARTAQPIVPGRSPVHAPTRPRAQRMRELRIATMGRIVSGVDAGRYVQILDDWANSGGFLILTYGGANDRVADGHDAWVESIVDVDLYFDESSWVVEWDEGPDHRGTDGTASRSDTEPSDE